MINCIYIYCFFFSLIIIYLLNKDLKHIKLKLYEEIDINIWIKLYSIITIALIHLTWLFYTLFLNYNDNNYIYGFPLLLLISYIIYIYAEFRKITDKTIADKTIATEKLNKYINYLMYIYIILLIIFIIIPVKEKEKIVFQIRKIINKFIVS
jgi:hypothetical protein